jgi:murein L,D-transpeptidase YcbB/YkuD
MKVAPALPLLGLLDLACGHAHHVENPEPRNGSSAADRRHEVPERTRSETGVPLATSSAGLLRPGAVEIIQQRLTRAGALAEGHESGKLDAATRAAVTHFQQEKGLAATGELDDATVEKLGLDPKDVFEAGAGAPK